MNNVSSVLINVEPKAHFKATCTYEFERIIPDFFKGGVGSGGAVLRHICASSTAGVLIPRWRIRRNSGANERDWMNEMNYDCICVCLARGQQTSALKLEAALWYKSVEQNRAPSNVTGVHAGEHAGPFPLCVSGRQRTRPSGRSGTIRPRPSNKSVFLVLHPYIFQQNRISVFKKSHIEWCTLSVETVLVLVEFSLCLLCHISTSWLFSFTVVEQTE